MGLFDYQSNGSGLFSDPNQAALLNLGLGLLAGSGPSRTPTSFGQILGQAGQQAQAGYQQAMQQQYQRRQQDNQDAIAKIQMQQHQAALDATRRAQEEQAAMVAEQKQRNDYLRSLQKGQQAGPQADMYGQTPNIQQQPIHGAMQQPQAQPQQAARASQHDQLLEAADYYQSRGTDAGFKLADQARSAAEKVRPEYATDFRQVTDPSTGKLVNVMVAKDGTIKPVSFGVRPDMKEIRLGNKVLMQDLNAVTPGQSFNIGQSPDSAASNAVTIRGQNMADARAKDRLNLDQTTPQYIETTAGIVALPKKLAKGEIPRGVLATDAQGQPLEKKKEVPQYIVTGVTKNAHALASIDSALLTLKTPAGKNAVGMKGYLPAPILNRMDQSGVDARANIADVGSLEIHDRSGAAVTASEFPRLAPFIPLATDDSATAIKKLERMKQLVESETNNLTFQYPGAKKLAEFASKQSEQTRSKIKKYNPATGVIE